MENTDLSLKYETIIPRIYENFHRELRHKIRSGMSISIPLPKCDYAYI